MTNKIKTTAPVSSVGADGEQPNNKNHKKIIANETAQINLQATVFRGFDTNWGCREIAIFPLFRTKRRIPWESCDLSHLFPRGVLLILFVLSLLYYFYAHKKNIRFLFYELFFMLFSHLFFLRIFSTFHEGIDDICLYFGQLHTA